MHVLVDHEGSATGWESRTNFERNPGIRGHNPLIHPRKTTNPLIFIPGIQESRTLFHAVADPSVDQPKILYFAVLFSFKTLLILFQWYLWTSGELL